MHINPDPRRRIASGLINIRPAIDISRQRSTSNVVLVQGNWASETGLMWLFLWTVRRSIRVAVIMCMSFILYVTISCSAEL
jgi:hypothetical protein